jgi:hypothetical protein
MIQIVVYAGDNIITWSICIDYDNPFDFLFLEMKIFVLMMSEL